MIEFEKYEQDTEFENQPKSIVHEEQNLMQTENDVICELNENFEENLDQAKTEQENDDVKGQHFLSVLNGFQKNNKYIFDENLNVDSITGKPFCQQAEKVLENVDLEGQHFLSKMNDTLKNDDNITGVDIITGKSFSKSSYLNQGPVSRVGISIFFF